MKLLWTKEAISNLHEIEKFIARDNLEAAIKFVDKLIDKAETLLENFKKKEQIFREKAVSRKQK